MRKFLAALSAAAILMIVAVPAFAHVTIQPNEAPTGSFFKFAVRVPNESDVANTKVEVTFPENLIFVSFQPKAGWERKVTMKKLDEPIEAFGASIDEVVDVVTWSGGKIGPGEFEEFNFSAKVPDEEGEIEFAATQTYEDGEVVTWQGAEDSDNPSPRATIVALPAEGDETTGALSLLAETSHEVADVKQGLADSNAHMGEMMAADDADSSGSDTGVLLGSIGIGLGALALIVSLMKNRGSPPKPE